MPWKYPCASTRDLRAFTFYGPGHASPQTVKAPRRFCTAQVTLSSLLPHVVFGFVHVKTFGCGVLNCTASTRPLINTRVREGAGACLGLTLRLEHATFYPSDRDVLVDPSRTTN
jgi:hypothetical protein